MKPESRAQFELESEDYLEKHNIFGIFQNLTEQLIVERPKDPLGFILGLLEKPVTELIVILTPPGSGFKGSYEEQIQTSLNAKVISLSNDLSKHVAKHSFANLPDSVVESTLEHHLPELRNLESNRILIGFPRTVSQVHMLRHRKVYPHKIFIVNYENAKLLENLEKKIFESLGKEGGDDTKKVAKQKAKEILDEYMSNLSQIKEIYRDIAFEIDGTKENEGLITKVRKI